MMQSKYMDFLKGAYGGGATGNPMAKMSGGGMPNYLNLGITGIGTTGGQQQPTFNAPAYFGNQGQPDYFGTPQYNQFAPPSYFGGNQQNPFE